MTKQDDQIEWRILVPASHESANSILTRPGPRPLNSTTGLPNRSPSGGYEMLNANDHPRGIPCTFTFSASSGSPKPPNFKGKTAYQDYVKHPMHQALLKWLKPLIDPVEIDILALD
jgi:hypothetical protein